MRSIRFFFLPILALFSFRWLCMHAYNTQKKKKKLNSEHWIFNDFWGGGSSFWLANWLTVYFLQLDAAIARKSIFQKRQFFKKPTCGLFQVLLPFLTEPPTLPSCRFGPPINAEAAWCIQPVLHALLTFPVHYLLHVTTVYLGLW